MPELPGQPLEHQFYTTDELHLPGLVRTQRHPSPDVAKSSQHRPVFADKTFFIIFKYLHELAFEIHISRFVPDNILFIKYIIDHEQQSIEITPGTDVRIIPHGEASCNK